MKEVKKKMKEEPTETSTLKKRQNNSKNVMATKKNEDKDKMVSIWHRITSDTPIHGFAYLTGAHRSTTQLIWAITLIAFNAAVFVMISKIRNTNPIISEIASMGLYAPSLPFAAITVCDVDLRARYFTKQQSSNESFDLQSYLRHLFHFKTNDEMLKHYKRLDDRNLFRFKSAGENADPVLLTDLTEQNTTKFGELTMEYLLSLSRSCEDMIPVCRWQGKPCDKEDFPRMVPTSFGFCCSFNYLGKHIEIDNATREYIDKIRPASLKEEQFVIANLNKSREIRIFEHIDRWRRFSKHKINVTYVKGNRTKPLEARGIGYGNGLSLLLKRKKDNNRRHGFQLLIHSSLDSPALFPPGLPMSLGTEVTSQLRVTQVSQAEQIRNYPVETSSDCRTFNKDGTPYSMRNCITECIAKSVEESCLCRPFFYFEGDKKYCNLFGMSCFWKNHGRILELMKNSTQDQLRNGVSACQCNPQCEGQQYKSTTQESPLFTNFELIHREYSDVLKEFMGGEEEEHSKEEELRRQQYLRGNFSIVNVFFRERATIDFHSRHLYTMSNVLPQVGGTMCLMTGFSMICLLCIISILLNVFFPSQRAERSLDE